MRSYSIVVFVAMLVFPAFAVAQPPGPGWGPDKHSFERIQQLMKMRMVETLDLNEEQSVRFIARFNEHEKHRRELMECDRRSPAPRRNAPPPPARRAPWS